MKTWRLLLLLKFEVMYSHTIIKLWLEGGNNLAVYLGEF